MGMGFIKFRSFPFNCLRMALETPVEDERKRDATVWIASVWVIYCGSYIFDTVRYDRLSHPDSLEIHVEQARRAYRLGPLCPNVELISVERWAFWKKRFTELAAASSTVNLKADTTKKVLKALESMEIAEK